MKLSRDEHGIWTAEADDAERQKKGDYISRLAEYLTTFDELLHSAQAEDPFQFILSLLSVRGLEGPGWDAFENTERAIDGTVRLHNEATDRTAAAHLRLSIYGHIVEASEPYSFIANLLDILADGAYSTARFPDQHGRPQSPGAKMSWIEHRAIKLKRPQVVAPFRERWDRELRNGIFHSDYALNGGDLRLVSVGDERTRAELDTLIGAANASHDALIYIRRAFIESYDQPIAIPATHFSPNPDERALVIVRERKGLIGVRAAPNGVPGQILWRMTRGCTAQDNQMLDADPSLGLLPASPTAPGPLEPSR